MEVAKVRKEEKERKRLKQKNRGKHTVGRNLEIQKATSLPNELL